MLIRRGNSLAEIARRNRQEIIATDWFLYYLDHVDAGDIDAGETLAHRIVAHRIEGEADPLLVVTDGAPGLIAGADPRRNGDDYPMTSLSDGLGPQKDPNSGRTRVESGPAGTHGPTTRRRSAIGASRGPRPET